MQFVIVLLIAAAVFGVCYLVDKGFSKAFRGKAQHRSGMAVRANKRFGVFGVVLTVLRRCGQSTLFYLYRPCELYAILESEAERAFLRRDRVCHGHFFGGVLPELRHFLRRGKLPNVPVREEGRCASL